MPTSPNIRTVAFALQGLLAQYVVPVAMDGVVGPETRRATEAAVALARTDVGVLRALQEFLQDYLCADTRPDGILGPKTSFAAEALLRLLSRGIWGGCPAWIGGFASHYGGPHDPNDRYLDQAYLPSPAFIDPSSGGRRVSPQRYFALAPEWVREVLDPKMADFSDWPTVQDEGGRSRPAGVSYFLRGHYVALRLNGRLAKKAKDGKVSVRITRDGRTTFIAPVIDYGPHPRMWASIDLSPKLYEALNNPPCNWQLRVMWQIVED